MAEASGVVELDDEVGLHFIKRNGAATTREENKEQPECIPHSCWYKIYIEDI
jgi:hypothetical protein